MEILCLGLSHRTAPVELRERLAYSAKARAAALELFASEKETSAVGAAELAILSTCNRVELYASISIPPAQARATAGVFEALQSFIARTRDIRGDEFTPYLYQHVGRDAVQHLCRVATGLDSMALGESQILGQVTEARTAALAHRAAGPLLAALFQTAIRAGRRAHSETAISRKPISLGSVAARKAADVVADLAAATVLIVGAGEMGVQAAKACRARGAHRIGVVNRTRARAAAIAQQFGGTVYGFEQLAQAIAAANIVITTAGATHTIIDRELLSEAIARRAGHSLALIDIAVPRNVDPNAANLPGVHLFDIDDLQFELQESLVERQAEIPLVEKIIAAETAAFEAWMKERKALPTIRALRRKAETIRRQELERTLRHIPDIDAATREHIQHLSKSLVNKLLHLPTTRLRAEAGNGRADQFAAVLRDLFDLQDDAPAGDDLPYKARG